jgi:hypothetical protein
LGSRAGKVAEGGGGRRVEVNAGDSGGEGCHVHIPGQGVLMSCSHSGSGCIEDRV